MFYFTLSKDITKMDPKAYACILLGYSPNQKGYKLYSTKIVFVSRDVKVFEKFFPFQVNADSPPCISKFFLPLSCSKELTQLSDKIQRYAIC